MSELSVIRPDGAVQLFSPNTTAVNVAKIDALIKCAIEIHNWPMLCDAIDTKIGEQQEFVRWWEENVRRKGGDGSNQHHDGANNADRGYLLPVEQAEAHTGITQQKVSVWRKCLADPETYRERQIISAYRKANINPDEMPHRTYNTGVIEWYTPSPYVEAAREVLGEIDLDPASSPKAQQTVKAKKFYTQIEDSLNVSWAGRVWMNPPYSRSEMAKFIEKILSEISTNNVTSAIVLTHSFTDTQWFHNALSKASALCFTLGRINFDHEGGKGGRPTHGQTFFYFGEDVDAFKSIFGNFGKVIML